MSNNKVRTNTSRGLRFRSSPLDGETLTVLQAGTELEVLAEEHWLRVRSPSGQVGFVSGNYVEPVVESTKPIKTVANVSTVTYTDPVFKSETPIRIHSDFVPVMEKIKKHAIDLDLCVFVTSSLRRPNQRIENAIVSPASLSNHHAGHAIDINLILDGQWYNSKDLGNWASLPDKICTFFELIRADNLRWGGDFTPADPVHIDDGLNTQEGQIFAKKVHDLWSNLV